MAFDMLLPEMGESIQEATIVKWLKSVGDTIEEDETILEVATDKVDSEVPSPISGKIIELKAFENDTVKIGSVIAIIEENTQSKNTSEAINIAKIENKINNSKKISRIAIEIPEMGESVQEANINKWLKDIGDDVKLDDNLLEISTDKVDTEVPSPCSGRLVEICVPEGKIAKIGETIAYIESNTATINTNEGLKKSEQVKKEEKLPSKEKMSSSLCDSTVSNSTFFSPLVKRIAKIEGISVAELKMIQGTGRGNRLTKNDILDYLKNRPHTSIKESNIQNSTKFTPPKTTSIQISYDLNRVTIEKMSTMRKGIAKHMVQSIYTAPHVFSVHEVNMKRIWDWRNGVKARFKTKYGFNLTLTHILMELIAKNIRKNPKINSSIDGDRIIIRHDINIGLAVGYTAKNGDNGLLVPVIRNTDELTLVGIARKSNEIITKTRNHQLKPDDMVAGTFTVTNVGTFGTEIGLGIINQPQVAIISLGAVIKHPVVTSDDAIQIAPMMKIALCYDHRVVDGMLAGKFLFDLQKSIENYKMDDEIV